MFGYFGTTWFIEWSMPGEGKDKNIHICEGPWNYCWGGSLLGVTNACPNPELAALVIYTLCCDDDVMYGIYDEDLDYPNNRKAVSDLIANEKGKKDYAGGYDVLSLFDDNARETKISQ